MSEPNKIDRRQRKHGKKMAETWLKGLSRSARHELGGHVERSLEQHLAYVIMKAEDGQFRDTLLVTDEEVMP